VNPFAHEDSFAQEIRRRLQATGQAVWQRYPLPWSHPSFRSCLQAAENLLELLPDANTFLVMRDACLAPVRVTVLLAGKVLVVPTRHGDGLLEVPPEALRYHTKGRQPVLRIEPPPPGAQAFNGTVDVVVVACLAYDPLEPRLYTFELEHTAYVLDTLRDGLPNGWRLPAGVPIVAVAADEQQVQDWPPWAQGYVEAKAVVTQSRVIELGSGEEVGMGADITEEVKHDEEQIDVGDAGLNGLVPPANAGGTDVCNDRGSDRGSGIEGHREYEATTSTGAHGGTTSVE
jgi:hypothetical protein